jgi:hypothetical protein
MRMLILGIVGLSGLAALVQVLGIHGNADERAAIRRAVHAPLRDLRRRDARALCQDFTPRVAAELTSAHGDCAAGVKRLFRRDAGAAEYAQQGSLIAGGRFAVTAVHRHGERATAETIGPGAPRLARRWQLALDDGRWRVATKAELQLRTYCGNHSFGARGCVDALSLSLDGTP